GNHLELHSFPTRRSSDLRGRITGTLIDLRGRVGTDGERGLHAVAFHPRFARNGKFYVHYNTPAGDTRVVEYRQRRPGQEVSPGSDRQSTRLNSSHVKISY